MKYLVVIDEVLTRRVVIEAADPCEAEQKAYDLANDGTINLTWDDFKTREIEVLGEAEASDLTTYEAF